MRNRFTFLGTGSSAGVPMIGCFCPVCSSSLKENKRLRPSGLLEMQGRRFLIDVGPDFRQQALRHQIHSLDGLLLTHTHYDHIAGIDELRAYYLHSQKYLPCLLSKESLTDLQKRYSYLFLSTGSEPTLSARLEFSVLENDCGLTDFLGLKISYVSFSQGGTKVNGFRLGNFAYISDIHEYEERIFSFLQGVEVLVLSAPKKAKSPLHLSLDEAIAFAKKTHAKKTYFTHISHEMDHAAVSCELPDKIMLGYDNLTLEFQYE